MKRLLAAVLLTLPASALAQAPSQSVIAESLFRDGQELMKAGKLEEACAKFSASYQTDATLGTLLNLANCHEKAGRTASAWNEFSEAAAKAAQASDKKRETFACGKVAALAPQLSKIAIDVASPAVKVQLDGSPFPPSAFGSAIPLDPGTHVVTASAPGKKDFSQTFTVEKQAGSQKVLVSLEPEAVAGALPPPTPPLVEKKDQVIVAHPPVEKAPSAADLETRSSSSSGSSMRPLGFVVGGVGVVALGVGGVFGLRARSLAGERDGLCPPGKTCFRQAALDKDHEARVSQRNGLVLAGVGVAALVAGGLMILSGPAEAPAAEPSRRAEPFTFAPALSPTSAGMSMAGSF